MKVQSVFLAGLILCVSGLWGVSNPCAALATRCTQWVAQAVSVQGRVEVQYPGDTLWHPVRYQDTFCPGDVLRTHADSRADLTLCNQSVLRLSQNARITLQKAAQEHNSLLDFFKGAAHFLSREPRSLKVRTPNLVAGIRGTEFYLEVKEETTFLTIFSGEVLARNKAGSLRLTSGQSARARADLAPATSVVARPRDAVHWALHYPPVIDRDETGPEDELSPEYHTGRASRLLAVGSVQQAQERLAQALKLEPQNSEALALQTIIAIVHNDKGRALDIAREAVRNNPDSATAHIALSYALQAHFDLNEALQSLQVAVAKDPQNALAWARLAEMSSSFGRLEEALQAARKASTLSPSLSRTQTVLGFASLNHIRIEDALSAFHEAIRLDQADPLPRLGLGLALIRKGKLHQGRQSIEIAASLAPNTSLIRSYLGKAYSEEKRTGLDDLELSIAKELDPKDPTPFFYDAIQKQTDNQQVKALQSMQRAIELNNNRAIYRSKLLLDSDLAARSASLARIYRDLGFDQLALVEGWTSVNTAPNNFSAHRFLADSYSALPRHEIARVSELLRSQLLQPLNMTPIQPRLAESNLFLISGQGPAELSFNEFNPLFARNRITVQTTGAVAEDETMTGEGIASAISDSLSLSAGLTHFETDGWRDNADQDDDIANVFLQWQASPDTSLQAEFRRRNTENGDLQLNFFEDAFFPDEHQDTDVDTFRLGFRHDLSHSSQLLANVQYADKKVDYSNRIQTVTPFLPGSEAIIDFQPTVDIDEDYFGTELQHIFSSTTLNIVSGGGSFDIQGEETEITETTVTLPPPMPSPPTSTSPPLEKALDVSHTNLYLYTYLNVIEDLTLTVGASGDFFDSDYSRTEDRDQFNPKLGLIWTPWQGTTLRGAIFRTLKRTLITDQTLEPTQVAGFNQFYDDVDSTEAWHFGGAIDQAFTERLYGGLSLAARALEVPAPLGGTRVPSERIDWDERLGRAYLYLVPHDWVGLSLEYLVESFDYSQEFNLGASEVTTHRLPLGIKAFHPCGASFSLKATYWHQKGEFLPFLADFKPENYVSESDDFWTVDAALSYRLPRRCGMVSLGARNLFDQNFEYFETDIDNPRVQPGRSLFFRITLELP